MSTDPRIEAVAHLLDAALTGEAFEEPWDIEESMYFELACGVLAAADAVDPARTALAALTAAIDDPIASYAHELVRRSCADQLAEARRVLSPEPGESP